MCPTCLVDGQVSPPSSSPPRSCSAALSAQSTGALLVMLVDKGFKCVKRMCAQLGALCFIPDAVVEDKQLVVSRAEYNREQSQLRVPIEHSYGRVKLCHRKLRRGVGQLGASKDKLVAHALTLQREYLFSAAVQNAKIRAKDKEIARLTYSEQSGFCGGSKRAAEIVISPGTALSGSARQVWSGIQQITKDMLTTMLDGHFREGKVAATNLIRKACKLVIAHRVLGIRWGRTSSGNLLLVVVTLGSYRRATYHTILEIAAFPRHPLTPYSDPSATPQKVQKVFQFVSSIFR